MAKKRKKKVQNRTKPRASDATHPSTAFTGPPELRRCAWEWETTKDGDDEELPKSEWVPVENCCVLAPGQTRGSETEWLAYFGEAEDSFQRASMVLKHADICFDGHPFNNAAFKMTKAVVVARWFARAGLPVRPSSASTTWAGRSRARSLPAGTNPRRSRTATTLRSRRCSRGWASLIRLYYDP